MARPKKSAEERRDLQVNVRLSAIEHAKLASRAAAAGVALADYMRQKSLTGRIKATPAEAASRLQALNRIAILCTISTSSSSPRAPPLPS
jgi:hypothetical protein